MSRQISQDILDNLAESEITTFHLLEFTVDGTTYRYTDCDIPLYSTSDPDDPTEHLFSPRSFSFNNVNYSTGSIVDSCKISIDNLDSIMTLIFVDNVIAEESCGLYMAVLDGDYTILGVQQIFKGLMNDFDIDESLVNIGVTSIFVRWDQISSSNYSSLCRWKQFKGTECRYSGDGTTCDRTYETCITYSNTDNFGGFRWLPVIEDKQIWWGPTPTERENE